MVRGENPDQLSIRRTAWRGIRKNFDSISTIAIVTVALRVAAFLPMFLSVDFGGKLPTWMGLAAAAAVYIAGAIPMRFWGREKMRRMFYSRHLNSRKKNVYGKWLKTGLVRYLRGILWGLPFLAGMVYFTVFLSILDAKTFWMPVRSLAVLVGKEPDLATGMIIALGLMIAFGLLFAFGWWRDLPVEYLPVRSLEMVNTFHWSRRIRKNYRKVMRRNTLVNILLCLPFWIGVAAVLTPYAYENVNFSLSSDMVAAQLVRLIESPLPIKTLLMLGGVVLALYVPFWIFRKTRNAALMGRLIRENSHASHSAAKKSENAGQQMLPKKVDFHPSMEGGQILDKRPPIRIGGEEEPARDEGGVKRTADKNEYEA